MRIAAPERFRVLLLFMGATVLAAIIGCGGATSNGGGGSGGAVVGASGTGGSSGGIGGTPNGGGVGGGCVCTALPPNCAPGLRSVVVPGACCPTCEPCGVVTCPNVPACGPGQQPVTPPGQCCPTSCGPGSGGSLGTGGSVGSGGSGAGGVVGTGASTGTGGSTGSGGGTTTGGTTGSGGSGGTNSGGTGGVSPGKASIEFTVAGGPYCHHGCDGPPSITVVDSAGHGLELGSDCYTDCKSCSISGCPPGPCSQDGIVTGANLDWDGSYLATSTCGSGTSCLEPAVAPPGKYTATFCATPGKLTGPDGGFQQCVTSGPQKCGSVEFDLPSSTVVKGTVGP